MLFLHNTDVMQVLDVRRTIDALRVGYEDLRRGEAAFIPRIDLWAATGRKHDYHQWGSMTGVCQSFNTVAVRIKSDIHSWEGGVQSKYSSRPGLYSGIILLYSTLDGAPYALIQDGYLQHLRVGGAAGLGTELLAREDASVVGMLGSGGMARTYLEAIAEIRRLSRVKVFSPTQENRDKYAREMSEKLDLEVIPVASAEEAIRGADIVTTATDSMAPTFDASWLSAGAHVNILTRRELSSGLLERSDRIIQLGHVSVPFGATVPDMEWSAGNVGSFVSGSPEDRARIPTAKAPETGSYPTMLDVQQGRADGRTRDDEITLWVNTGTQGVQFSSVGAATYRAARERGLGTEFPTEWFLEDIRN